MLLVLVVVVVVVVTASQLYIKPADTDTLHSVETNNQPTTPDNHQEPRTMKSFVSLVFLNIALARPDHGGLHHRAHHGVHHQPATVHHAVHQPMLHHAVHHNAVHHHQPVHHNQVVPVVAKVAPKTIAELVVSEPRFSTLLAAVKAADLVDTLSGEGSFTVFAPTNEAFKKVPEEALAGLLANKEELKAVLLRHVVPSSLQGKNIPPGTTALTTAGGEEISVTRDSNNLIQIKSAAGSAYVVLFDVIASNGVVHAVDSVF